MVTQWFADLWTWCNALPPDMAFFFLLPFIVAAGGLFAHAWRRK
jgi:hypothetical protein